MNRGRLATVAAVAGLLVAAVLPFVVLFPDPPAFGPESVLLAAFATVAAGATAWRAERTERPRILRQASVLFGVTAATAVSSMVLGGGIPLVPTLDLLPALFGLHGEDADAAILFEAWCELWLVWALVAVLLAWLLPRRPAPASRIPSSWHDPVQHQPWNAATVLLWAVGWCAMAGTVVEGHRTAAFLAHATRVAGVIANKDSHPLIRFTTGDGTTVIFRQNGGISPAIGAGVPVAYDPADPASTAQADTLFSAWSEIMGLACESAQARDPGVTGLFNILSR